MARILLIEDDPDINDLMCSFLGLEGHCVWTARDAEETRTLLGQGIPDIVLMDLSLRGDVDGFELTRRLRADPDFDGVPIIAVTAHAMNDHRERALAAGCDAHWTKPIVDLRHFGDALNRALSEGRRRLRTPSA